MARHIRRISRKKIAHELVDRVVALFFHSRTDLADDILRFIFLCSETEHHSFFTDHSKTSLKSTVDILYLFHFLFYHIILTC